MWGCDQVKIALPAWQGAGSHAPCSWSPVLMKLRKIIFNQCHALEEKEPLGMFINSHRKKTLRRPSLDIPASPFPPPLTCTERSPSRCSPSLETKARASGPACSILHHTMPLRPLLHPPPCLTLSCCPHQVSRPPLHRHTLVPEISGFQFSFVIFLFLSQTPPFHGGLQ